MLVARRCDAVITTKGNGWSALNIQVSTKIENYSSQQRPLILQCTHRSAGSTTWPRSRTVGTTSNRTWPQSISDNKLREDLVYQRRYLIA
ncbi:hypothetical protein CEP51_016278 [Fusarium floridanum]|uniref:Uncharacterized protein n=1 Tax=Fusarium floridanum TaxID=1325733 RepID=A0A428NTG3_9HYPO|nr:hypothetical protein CEP51_016278 [Fusarium floridanum]